MTAEGTLNSVGVRMSSQSWEPLKPALLESAPSCVPVHPFLMFLFSLADLTHSVFQEFHHLHQHKLGHTSSQVRGATKTTAFRTVLKGWALQWSFAASMGTETSSTEEGQQAGRTDTLKQCTEVYQLTFYWITKTRSEALSRTSSYFGKMSLCWTEAFVPACYTPFLYCGSQGSTLSIASFT